MHSCGHERYGLDVNQVWYRHENHGGAPARTARTSKERGAKGGTTLSGLLEEGLQRSLEARRRNVQRLLDFPTYAVASQPSSKVRRGVRFATRFTEITARDCLGLGGGGNR